MLQNTLRIAADIFLNSRHFAVQRPASTLAPLAGRRGAARMRAPRLSDLKARDEAHEPSAAARDGLARRSRLFHHRGALLGHPIHIGDARIDAAQAGRLFGGYRLRSRHDVVDFRHLGRRCAARPRPSG